MLLPYLSIITHSEIDAFFPRALKYYNWSGELTNDAVPVSYWYCSDYVGIKSYTLAYHFLSRMLYYSYTNKFPGVIVSISTYDKITPTLHYNNWDAYAWRLVIYDLEGDFD